MTFKVVIIKVNELIIHDDLWLDDTVKDIYREYMYYLGSFWKSLFTTYLNLSYGIWKKLMIFS